MNSKKGSSVCGGARGAWRLGAEDFGPEDVLHPFDRGSFDWYHVGHINP